MTRYAKTRKDVENKIHRTKDIDINISICILLTGICSVFPRAVIREDQKPRMPRGRRAGDMVMDTLNLTSEILRSLKIDEI